MNSSISKSNLWLLCVVLTLPALLPLFLHFFYSSVIWHDHATGFIQYDQPYYMANAREYFDDGNISLTYKNPSDFRADAPKLYFQPQSFVLGLIHKYTQIHPMYLFVAFGWLFSLLTVRVAYSLLNEFLPLQNWTSHLVFVLFVWGGGLFTLAGFATILLKMSPDVSVYEYLTMYDPFQGWWFLNLGRNLIFPMESYYHFLFLLGSLFLVRNEYWPALAVGFLISCSHPFTGVEYLFIVVGWLVLERVFWENRGVSWYAIGAAIGLLLLHVGYYQFFLTRFASHRAVQEVWQLAWEYKAVNMLLGYGIVGALTAWRVRTAPKFQAFLAEPKHRYLVMWFLGAFLLANHEFFMKSVQPLHFTRGYVWIPLFLAGAVVLYQLLIRFEGDRSNRLAVWGIAGVLLLDNFIWLSISTTDRTHNSMHTKVDYREVMKSLNEVPFDHHVVVCNSRPLSYLSTVLTPHETYTGHEMLTPHIVENFTKISRLVSMGELIDDLADQKQLVILDKFGSFVDEESFEATKDRIKNAYVEGKFLVEVITEADDFIVWKCEPYSAQKLTNGRLAVFRKDSAD